MADKEYPLSFVLKAVDKATGPIDKVAARLEKMNAPMKKLSKGLSKVWDESGMGKIAGAAGGVVNAVGALATKLLVVGAAGALAARAVIGMVKEFDDLGDTAAKLGVPVDMLAQMRYAAERMGSSTETLDKSLGQFNKRLGELKAGGGAMKEFLGKVSPALLTQVKHAKSTQEAFGLIADAMVKIKDPAKRAAFANAVLGKSGQDLIPLLMKGSGGIKELMDRYLQLAGSQEGAAAAAGKADDSFKDLGAAVQGVKAAIVAALGPVITNLTEQLTTWFTDNREKVTAWLNEFGEKLPSYIDKGVAAFKSIIETGAGVVNFFGGLQNTLMVLAAFMSRNLIAALVKLEIAVLASPLAPFLIACQLLIAAGALLYSNWDDIKDFFILLWSVVKEHFDIILAFIAPWLAAFILPIKLIVENWDTVSEFFVGLWDGIVGVFESAWEKISAIVDKVAGAASWVADKAGAVANFLNPFSDDEESTPAPTFNAASARPSQPLSAEDVTKLKGMLQVVFSNAPKGTRISQSPDDSLQVDYSTGYALGMQ